MVRGSYNQPRRARRRRASKQPKPPSIPPYHRAALQAIAERRVQESERKIRIIGGVACVALLAFGIVAITVLKAPLPGLVALALVYVAVRLRHEWGPVGPSRRRAMNKLIEQWDTDRKLVKRWRTGSLPRHSRELSTPVKRAHISVQEWTQILEFWDEKCAYCGVDLNGDVDTHKEHAVPLARGGADAPTNIVPACAPCNLAKGTRTGLEYVELRKSRKQHINPLFAQRVKTDGEPSPPDEVRAAMERLDEITESARAIGSRNRRR